MEQYVSVLEPMLHSCAVVGYLSFQTWATVTLVTILNTFQNRLHLSSLWGSDFHLRMRDKVLLLWNGHKIAFSNGYQKFKREFDYYACDSLRGLICNSLVAASFNLSSNLMSGLAGLGIYNATLPAERPFAPSPLVYLRFLCLPLANFSLQAVNCFCSKHKDYGFWGKPPGLPCCMHWATFWHDALNSEQQQ